MTHILVVASYAQLVGMPSCVANFRERAGNTVHGVPLSLCQHDVSPYPSGVLSNPVVIVTNLECRYRQPSNTGASATMSLAHDRRPGSRFVGDHTHRHQAELQNDSRHSVPGFMVSAALRNAGNPSHLVERVRFRSIEGRPVSPKDFVAYGQIFVFVAFPDFVRAESLDLSGEPQPLRFAVKKI